MSTCRRMCHTDVGAPIYYGYKRDAIYDFMDTVFITGYNELFALNYSREGRILTLNYAAPHGYKVGQLLAINGATYSALNKNHRVIEVPSTNALKIYIKDDNFASYPESSSETTMQTKVAPFNWEKVYESSTQRSYRSRLANSSKIVFTIKQPTYNTTKFITEGAIAYEVDFSKDVDPATGSPIDSCFAGDKTAFGHTARYWVVTTNSDDIFNSMNYSTVSQTPAPWSMVGDESMVYFISCPFEGYNEWNNKNSYYRQYDTYTGQTRFSKCYAFGDIEAENTDEYTVGSSFYFKMYYARVGSYEGSITSPENNPFIRHGSWSWWDAFFSAYDPTGTSVSARMTTIASAAESGYNYSGSGFLWNAYPQRVSGGFTYYDYMAYSDGPSAGRNATNCFYKGKWKYVKFCDTNLTNIGNPGVVHNMVHPTNIPYKFLFTVNNSSNTWTDLNNQGYYTFELD